MLELKVGKQYKDMRGHGPYTVEEGPDYEGQFWVRTPDNNGYWFEKDGTISAYGRDHLSLVAEWSDPRVDELPPIEIGDFPICRVLVAKEPKPGPTPTTKERVVWAWMGPYTYGHTSWYSAIPNDAVGVTRVTIRWGQFDHLQPGDRL